jgi:hypothetical protein
MTIAPTPSPERKRSSAARVISALVIGVITLSCACCILSVAMLKMTGPSGPVAVAFSGTLCAGFTLPPVRAGVTWQSVILSRLSPLALSPWSVCVNTPHVWPFTNPANPYWELLLP